MAKKISIKFDVNKIPKNLIVERRFTDNAGKEVVLRECTLDVVELNTPKVIKSGDTWEMVKEYFVALGQTPEERKAKVKSVIIGDGIVFKDKNTQISPETAKDIKALRDAHNKPKDFADSEDINPEDIPF